MRKIIASLSVSLDGMVESPETWTGPWLLREGLLDELDLPVRTSQWQPGSRSRRVSRIRLLAPMS